jgi:predicted PurR-regulated permease PerM
VSTPDQAGSSAWTARRVRASGSSILLALLAIVAVLLGRNVFIAATQPLGWVAAAAATALVLWPLIEWQSQWIPRGIAIVVTLVTGVAVAAGAGVGLFLEIQDQLGQLGEQLPAAAAALEERHGPDSVVAQLEFSVLVQDVVDQTSQRILPEPTIENAVGTVPAYLVSAVLVVFFLVWGRTILDGASRQIADPGRRDRVAAVATAAASRAQRYVVGALGVGVVVAVVVGLVAWWADLPTPLVLGVVVGAASIIPYIGVLFGAVPVLLLSAASQPATTTVLLALALVALQACSTVAMREVVEARTLRVGPAVIVIAALVGSDLYGIGGTLVAVMAGIVAVAAVDALSRGDDLPPQSRTPATTIAP